VGVGGVHVVGEAGVYLASVFRIVANYLVACSRSLIGLLECFLFQCELSLKPDAAIVKLK